MVNNCILLTLCFLTLFSSANCCSVHAVVAAIFKDYMKLVRPVIEINTTVDVRLELKVYNIIAVNEPDESVDLLLWTTALWYDEFLTWNPADFDNCTGVKVHSSLVWLPDIYFLNSQEIKQIAPPDTNFVHIRNDGQIRLHSKYNIRLACPLEIQRFPFDTQTCPITVGLWTYNYSEIVLRLRYPIINLASYNGDPNFEPIMSNASEFETIGFSGEEKRVTIGLQNYSELHYKLTLKRLPEYYIYVMIIPSFLLTTLCIIGIFTPNTNINERIERVTLGLTTLLSMAVILNIVANEMPKSSHGLPLLGIFILYEIGVCTLATILSTGVLVLHQRAQTRAWKPTQLSLWIAGRSALKAYYKTTSRNMIDSEISVCYAHKEAMGKALNKDRGTKRPISVLHETCSILRLAINNMENRLKYYEERAYNASVWQIFCDWIDSVLLAFLLIVNIIGSYLILI